MRWTAATLAIGCLGCGLVESPSGTERVLPPAMPKCDEGRALPSSVAGELDPSFGEGGVAILDVEGASVYPDFLRVQSDGRLLVAGRTEPGPAGELTAYLLRLNPDGLLDDTFAEGGIFHFALPETAVALSEVDVMGDDRIVATLRAISLVTFEEGPVVFRLTADGRRDESFAGSGVLELAREAAFQVARTAIEPDGSLLLAGIRSQASARDLVVRRLRPDGMPDPMFGQDGESAFAYEGEVSALAIEADGRILVGGRGDDPVVFARLRRDGTLDDGFGTAGILRPFPGEDYVGEVTDIIPMENGAIRVAGSVGSIRFPIWAVELVEFDHSGTRNPWFGGDGTGLADVPVLDFAQVTVIQADCRIVVGSRLSESGAGLVGLGRLLPDGAVDTGFGVDGVVTGPSLLGSASPLDVVATPDGRIAVLGWTEDMAINPRRAAFVAVFFQ